MTRLRSWPHLLLVLVLLLGAALGRPSLVFDQLGIPKEERPELTILLGGTDRTLGGTPRTDTILFISLFRGHRAVAVSIPRDTLVDLGPRLGVRRINTAYPFGGAALFVSAVESVLEIPVDYYALVDLELFIDVVDALGGVDLFITDDIDYDDIAGGLHIHFKAGFQHLDGAASASFVRYRGWAGSDLGRIDQMKRLLLAVLGQAQRPQTLLAIPSILRSAFANLPDHNLDLALVLNLLPRLIGLDVEFSTLPVTPNADGATLSFEQEQVRRFIAETLRSHPLIGTVPRDIPIYITNSASDPEAGARAQAQLQELGFSNVALRATRDRREEPLSFIEASSSQMTHARALGEIIGVGQVRQVFRLLGGNRLNLIAGNDLAEQ
ncbi:MAG: LCP family protein [Deinococcus sp.]|nr:LCP family protein [Deinococcus sp.]